MMTSRFPKEYEAGNGQSKCGMKLFCWVKLDTMIIPTKRIV